MILQAKQSSSATFSCRSAGPIIPCQFLRWCMRGFLESVKNLYICYSLILYFIHKCVQCSSDENDRLEAKFIWIMYIRIFSEDHSPCSSVVRALVLWARSHRFEPGLEQKAVSPSREGIRLSFVFLSEHISQDYFRHLRSHQEIPFIKSVMVAKSPSATIGRPKRIEWYLIIRNPL